MRTSGILLSISSLPSKYGVGSFDKEAFDFIDLLNESGITIWQILPLCPLGYGNSPYQSTCSKAIDPIYISLDDLHEKGYISKPHRFNTDAREVDFASVRSFKEKYIKKAFKNQKDTETLEFKEFLNNNNWVINYAKFSILTKKNSNKPWYEWKESEKEALTNNFNFSKYENEVLYYEWVQFILYKELNKIIEYGLKNNVKLMGDIPFYVGANSSDVRENQKSFLLDEKGEPSFVAGCPPDFFSKTGQRWGNPIYNWDYLKENNFAFRIDRIKFELNTYSLLRIDHFRAFDTYYKIPASSPTAEIGEWIKCYGDDIFNILKNADLKGEIVAEDLGDLVPSVIELRDKYNLKGMNVIQFNILNPKFKTLKNQIIYTGTHDNDTICGWYKSLDKKEKILTNIVLRMNNIKAKKINKKFIEFAFSSICDYAIIPMQDFLGEGSKFRMNVPGVVNKSNWAYKLESFEDFKKEIPYIKSIIGKYNR